MSERHVSEVRTAPTADSSAGQPAMSVGAPFQLRVCHGKSHATVLTARGEIDLSSCRHLRELLSAAVERGTTVLDLAEVGFCDSSGLRVLVEAEQAARANGAAFRLAAVSEAVRHVLEISCSLDVFELFRDVDSALRD